MYRGLSSLSVRRRGVHDVQTRMALRRARGSGGPRFAGTFNAAEVMAVRPEDKNARQDPSRPLPTARPWPELEQHLAFLRSLGAPDDAHPKVGVNEDYEVTMMICVVERPTAQASTCTFLKGRSGALASGPLGRALAAYKLVRAVDEASAEQAHAPVSAAPLPGSRNKPPRRRDWSTGNCRWRDVWSEWRPAFPRRAPARLPAAYDELEHARRVWVHDRRLPMSRMLLRVPDGCGADNQARHRVTPAVQRLQYDRTSPA